MQRLREVAQGPDVRTAQPHVRTAHAGGHGWYEAAPVEWWYEAAPKCQ